MTVPPSGRVQAPDDVQADANSPEPAAVAGLALHEPLEDPLMIAWSDPDALVFDVHRDHWAGRTGAHGDGAARG
jgi:hypothetical protein